jgi:ribosome-associated heat shock protein Hsp15
VTNDGARKGQRVDTWLWHARLFKTRTLAADVVVAGKVRLTRDDRTARIGKTSHLIRPGDTLTFPKGRLIRIVRIEALATRRGPAPEAQALYEDLTPPLPPKGARPIPPAQREAGAGRPTKKDRRALDALRGLDPDAQKKV